MRTYVRAAPSAPLVRLRFMAAGLAVVVLLIAGPLLLVWKQAYISSTALRLEAMTDTLTVQNRQIAALRFRCEQLSRNERIEKFARTALRLEYPLSDRIVIVPAEEKQALRGLAFVQEHLVAAKGGRQ
jgi:hypothetical protein